MSRRKAICAIMSQKEILDSPFGGSDEHNEYIGCSLAIDCGIPGYRGCFTGVRDQRWCKCNGHAGPHRNAGSITAFGEWGDRVTRGEWGLAPCRRRNDL